VQHLTLLFKNLPKSFDGFKIIQLSDIHSGSFTNMAGVQKGVDLVNGLAADLVLFTGDLVNNKADEMQDYLDVFKKIQSTQGVYSILGNHDYGDYHQWKKPEEKVRNLQQLKSMQESMGWRLLLDENVQIEKNGETISLIGVENISSSFNSYGNLSNAYRGAENSTFKILMSHDPSHWSKEVIKDFKDIDLTLSGHTHGFQFGIEMFGIKWSPAKYIYKQWAGLYQEGQQFIYVNRGFGFLGYPGRVGILPEITLITLQSE
jgi:predicted MPP superfamily phosphohydrolase